MHWTLNYCQLYKKCGRVTYSSARGTTSSVQIPIPSCRAIALWISLNPGSDVSHTRLEPSMRPMPDMEEKRDCIDCMCILCLCIYFIPNPRDGTCCRLSKRTCCTLCHVIWASGLLLILWHWVRESTCYEQMNCREQPDQTRMYTIP